jgi:hypothetical protein
LNDFSVFHSLTTNGPRIQQLLCPLQARLPFLLILIPFY